MPDDVKELPEKKGKNPVDSSIEKIKEAAAKENAKKIDEALQAWLTSQRNTNTLFKKFQEVLKIVEAEKAEMNEMLKGVK